ncbi:MAG: hypothetical protein J2P27_11875 [Actinobacteria bacterium]|nr:hypothetical protein [Actinomycetota bacterium]
MLTILILAGSAAVSVVLLLVIVIIGIRQEPSMEELGEQAGSPIAAFVRRLLGVYVRKPELERDGKVHASLLAGSTDKPDLE